MPKRVDWYYHRNGCTACTRASRFLDARGIEAEEVVPASRKLSRSDAAKIAKAASRIIVAKGKKLDEFSGGQAGEATIGAMLGPTGNLRAPCIRAGKIVLVGFNEEAYAQVFD